MVEAILVFLFQHFARGRPQQVFTSVLLELWSDPRLLARLGQPRKGLLSVLHSIVFDEK